VAKPWFDKKTVTAKRSKPPFIMTIGEEAKTFQVTSRLPIPSQIQHAGSLGQKYFQTGVSAPAGPQPSLSVWPAPCILA
jgi:hypothetical protein